MRPLDPRLLRYARSARGYVALTAGLGILTAALVVAQALLLADALGRAVHDAAALADVAPAIGWLAVVVLARALVTAAQERWAHRAAVRAVGELREAVVARAVALGPGRRGPRRTGAAAEGTAAATATLATRGLDALEPYFVRYLPQLVLAATVTPGTLLVVLGLDWVSALLLLGALPLVPLFMVLVGRLTEGRSAAGLATMQRLGSQVLDLLAGLPTLRAYGRERGPEARVRSLGDAHRRATTGTLRIAFLSGMVLELLTTLGVALVAVGIGLRLVDGGLDLVTGLAVLVLAPEVFWPLRQVGAQFHAAADGVAAANQAFALLDEPVPARGSTPAPDLAATTLRLQSVAVRTADRYAPAGLEVTVRPGTIVALVGPSGTGKSTALDVLLGLQTPDEGRVLLETPGGTLDLRDVDLPSFWRQVAWLPQRPVLEPGTIARAVGGASDRVRRTAAALTGLDTVLAETPDGWDTVLGRDGAGLSLGQRQRVALTRALLSDAPLVLLDEPTAHLDDAAEQVVLDTVARLRTAGRTVLLVAHRATLVACADHVVTVAASPDRVLA